MTEWQDAGLISKLAITERDTMEIKLGPESLEEACRKRARSDDS